MFERILAEDVIATFITLGFVAVQFFMFLLIQCWTTKPLSRSRRTLRQILSELTRSRDSQQGLRRADQEDGSDASAIWQRELTAVAKEGKVARAWDLSVGAQRDPSRAPDALEPEAVFVSARLLPRGYNHRLDAALPGVFMAVGIMGTFAGLIAGFWQVDPEQASQSVGPLIGGMLIAFINSLFGVLFSLVWTGRSRWLRHAFDEAVEDLLVEAEYRFRRSGLGDQLRTGFEMLAGHLDRLEKSNRESSQGLLDGLSPKLAESFQTLVATPFELLTASVHAFDGVVRAAMQHQDVIAERLSKTSEILAEAKESLASSVATAQSYVREFTTSTEQLKEGASETRDLLAEIKAASTALDALICEVRLTAEHHGEATRALYAATSALGSTGERLEIQSAAFGQASASLDHCLGEMRMILEQGVGESVKHVHGELESAVGRILDGLADVGVRTVRAHKDGSTEVVTTLQREISALTNRLSEEVGGVVAAVPTEIRRIVEEIEEAGGRTVAAQKEGSTEVVAALQREISALTSQLGEEVGGVVAGVPTAIQRVVQEIEAAGGRTVAAQKAGSSEVVTTLQREIATLTTRLSEDLGGIASALPEQIKALNHSLATDFKGLAEQFPVQVGELVQQMESVHSRTLEAYVRSTREVVDTIDERMSDLTDRLAAELTTLAARLPAEVSSLNAAMIEIRNQIRKATLSMEDSVHQLAQETPESLRARLREFDGALASAMDHFSGTLSAWNDRVDDIQKYSQQLHRIVRYLASRGGPAAATVADARPS